MPYSLTHIQLNHVLPHTFMHMRLYHSHSNTHTHTCMLHKCIIIHTVHVHTLVHGHTHSCLSMHSPYMPVHSHAHEYKNQIGQETKDLQPSREGRGGSGELGQAVEGSVEGTMSERGGGIPTCIALPTEAALSDRPAACSLYSSLCTGTVTSVGAQGPHSSCGT